MLTVGLISDTHGLLRPEVFHVFAGVDHIIHAGDVGPAEILTELEAIAPVTAVWGNTDGSELRARLPEVAQIRLGDVEVAVVHGQQFGSPTPARVAGAYPDKNLIVFGHSHIPAMERLRGLLAVNPGSAGPKRFRLPATVAIATLQGHEVDARLISLDEIRSEHQS